MTNHELKIEAQWFDRIANLSKTAEIRKHDRDFQIGDRIRFITCDEDWDTFKGKNHRAIWATITHILPASVFSVGLQPGYSMLSLSDLGDFEMIEMADR